MSEKIILFGVPQNIAKAFNDVIIKDCQIVGVCQDSIIDELDGVDEKLKLSFEQLSQYVDALIVVVDERISSENERFFSERGLQYVLRSTYLSTVEQNGSSDATDEVFCNESVTESEESLFEEVDNRIDDKADDEIDKEVDDKSSTSESGHLPVLSDEQFNELQTVISDGIDSIIKAIRNTKAKDDSIYNINKELQKYKDDYYLKTVSPLVSDLISLREDCKKSLEDCDQYALSSEKMINYLDCTVEEVNNTLDIFGISESNGLYYYRGELVYPNPVDGHKCYSAETERIEIPTDNCSFDQDEFRSVDIISLPELLQKWQYQINSILSENTKFVDTIRVANESLSKQQSVCDGLLIVPTLKKLVQSLEFLLKRKKELSVAFSEEESKEIYKRTYVFLIDYLEKVLLGYNVTIRSQIDDVFDPKIHKVLKMVKISQEEIEKDKKISKVISDCYMLGDKVVSPAKVVLYRL